MIHFLRLWDCLKIQYWSIKVRIINTGRLQPWNYPNGVYNPIPAFLDHLDIDLSLSELEDSLELLNELDSNDE